MYSSMSAFMRRPFQAAACGLDTGVMKNVLLLYHSTGPLKSIFGVFIKLSEKLYIIVKIDIKKFVFSLTQDKSAKKLPKNIVYTMEKDTLLPI